MGKGSNAEVGRMGKGRVVLMDIVGQDPTRTEILSNDKLREKVMVRVCEHEESDPDYICSLTRNKDCYGDHWFKIEWQDKIIPDRI